MVELIIKDLINSEFASDNEQGNLIFTQIKDIIENGTTEEIYLNFENLSLITTAFLNNAIGKLYKQYPLEKISKLLKIKNIKDKDDLELLRLVIMNAIEMSK